MWKIQKIEEEMTTTKKILIFSGSSLRSRTGKRNKHFNVSEIKSLDSILKNVDLPFIEFVSGTKKEKHLKAKDSFASLEFRLNDSISFSKHNIQSGVSSCVLNPLKVNCDVISIFNHEVSKMIGFDDLGVHFVSVKNQNSFADAIVELGFIDNDNFISENLLKKTDLMRLSKSIEQAFETLKQDFLT